MVKFIEALIPSFLLVFGFVLLGYGIQHNDDIGVPAGIILIVAAMTQHAINEHNNPHN